MKNLFTKYAIERFRRLRIGWSKRDTVILANTYFTHNFFELEKIFMLKGRRLTERIRKLYQQDPDAWDLGRIGELEEEARNEIPVEEVFLNITPQGEYRGLKKPNVGARVLNTLERIDIGDLRELIAYSGKELLTSSRDFGRVSLDYLREVLGEYGLRLKGESDEFKRE